MRGSKMPRMPKEVDDAETADDCSNDPHVASEEPDAGHGTTGDQMNRVFRQVDIQYVEQRFVAESASLHACPSRFRFRVHAFGCCLPSSNVPCSFVCTR